MKGNAIDILIYHKRKYYICICLIWFILLQDFHIGQIRVYMKEKDKYRQ